VLVAGPQSSTPHQDDAGLEVDILPLQSKDLALAETQREGDDPAGGVAALDASSRSRWTSSTEYGSTSVSSSTGALAIVAGFSVMALRRTASFSATRTVRWTW
jgi:hypothetical protein